MKKGPNIIQKIGVFVLRPIAFLLQKLSKKYVIYISLFKWMPASILNFFSKLKAYHVYLHAKRKVPAYRHFCSVDDSGIPIMDKKSYVMAYSIEERCVNGRLPNDNLMIDESSGSTGTPFNWVRWHQERAESLTSISHFIRYCYGNKLRITLNAFSQGAWATGWNMGLALQKNGIVKNVGPDVKKLLNTLSFFGKNYSYLILGYPPFLKYFIDEAEKQKFPLHEYKLNALVGGEGMFEGLRDYLYTVFDKVYSGYGATDLEIGIAGETPITVAIRRLARENKELKEAVFGVDSRLPMLFQYNPLWYYIEVNDNKELLFTITRTSVISPRIRYNIKDKGGIATYQKMEALFQKHGYNFKELIGDNMNLKLPFVWINGRSDYTLSIMGANIYPEDIEQCVYSIPSLAKQTRSYCLSYHEENKGIVRPKFIFEVYELPDKKQTLQYQKQLLENILNLNTDFREAYKEYPDILIPYLKFYPIGEGPFVQKTGQIKQVRILK